MIDESSEKITVESFGGSATLPDATHVKFPQALIAANQIYTQGSASTRLGFGLVLSASEPTVGEIATAMFNWQSSLGNYLTWFRISDRTWRVRNIASGPAGTAYSLGGSTAYAMSFANAGARLYAAFFTTAGLAATFGRVLSYQVSWTRAAATLTDISVAANVATATTVNPHMLTTGNLVVVAGATVDTDLNGAYAVTGTPSATTFTFATSGVTQPVVYNEATLTIAALLPDNLSQGPIVDVPVMTEPGAGSVTAGDHRVGYLLEFRSGFTTRPSPSATTAPPTVSSFLPVTFTASGSLNGHFALTSSWRTGAVKVHVIMSPVSNPNRYFKVPGANTTVIGGVLSAVAITFDISDDDLYATAEEVTDSLNLWTCSTGDVAPFSPSVVFPNGNRMGYVTTIPDNIGNATGALVMSEIGKFQAVTADQNVIQLPGQQDIMTACFLADGATYIFGIQWTFRTRDNGQAPATWPTPQPVSQNIGSPSARGICPSADGSYCWVAARPGLYLFTGAYDPLPASYLSSPTWGRINWAVPQALQVKDNPTTKQVFVLACLDTATVPNYIMTFDYTDGKSYDRIRFSLDSVRNETEIGAIEVVENTASLVNSPQEAPPASVYTKQELWLWALVIGYTGAQGFFRSKSEDDRAPYRDLSTFNIPANYRTALLRSQSKPNLWTHQGGMLRLTGEGSVAVSAYGVDGTPAWPAQLVPLSEAPGNDYEYWMDLLAEAISYDFEIGQNNTIDPTFALNDGSWTVGTRTGAGNWSIVTGDAPNAHTGTSYAKHTGANTICEFVNSTLTFDVTEGESYEVEAWFKSTGSPDGSLLFGLEYFNAAGVSQGFVITPLGAALSATSGASYTLAVAVYTIPAGASYVRPKFQILNKTTGTWYADDVYFTLIDTHVKLSGIRHQLAEWAMQS